MAFVIFGVGVILLTVALLLIMVGRRHQQSLFMPLMRVKGTDLLAPPVGMGAAAGHSDQNITRTGGRMRAGSVCFVTGMSRPACACPDCERQGEGR